MWLLFQSGTAIFVPHSHPCQYLSLIDMILFRQVRYCFSLFYTPNDDVPLVVTVLHKKHPKSFVSNFWGAVQIEVMLKDETVWLSQKLIALLFDVDRTVITKHLKNIFDTHELEENSVCAFFAHTAEDGKSYNIKYYNLDAIISVGYRVNSKRATAFRQWATSVLRDYAIRGYVIDRKRMENGAFLGEDYFEHLLAEIRETRLSERRFYQKMQGDGVFGAQN